MSGKETKQSSDSFDFLLEPSVQFENRVSPTEAAKERFSMEDSNHRHVTGQEVWDVYSSPAFRESRASQVRASLADVGEDAPDLAHH